MPTQPRAESGFLLVELLVAMTLLGILFVSFAELTSMVAGRNATLTKETYLTAQGRAGIDAISTELESAMCNGTTTPITVANATELQFTAPDRQSPFHLQQLTYQLQNGVFTRQVAQTTNTSADVPPASWSLGGAGPAEPVVDSVVNNPAVVFQYFDSSGKDLSPKAVALTSAQLPSIARVVITLTIQPSGSHGTGSLTAQGSAAVRQWITGGTCPT